MKSYGVNWFLVWFGLLVFMWPFYLWMQDTLFFRWDPTFPASAQGISQPFCWTFLYWLLYPGALADPVKLERVRQSRRKSQTFRYRRYRWLILWATVFAVVATVSLICKVFFHHPVWLHLIGYSLVLPSTSVCALWLLNRGAEKGQVEQLLKIDDEAGS